MKRIGAFLITIVIILSSMVGMWFYQSWRDSQEAQAEKTIENAYIILNAGSTMKVYAPDGSSEEYTVNSDLKDISFVGTGDVTVYRKKVKKLVRKPEKIVGRVLSIQDNSLEIENYGVVPIDKKCSFFAVGNAVLPSDRTSLYVGQTNVNFSVANGSICSVLLPEEANQKIEKMKSQKIRVLLKTEDYSSYEHANVKLKGTNQLCVTAGDKKTMLKPGEEWNLSLENLKDDRVYVENTDGGKIELLSLKRSGASPSYRGRLEISKGESGLHIVNELDLEEYLYGVVPSEMPAEYSKEALKAQAVCARSYALIHIKNNRLKEYGAHVDDSVSYQVYQNTPEDDRCNVAVDETKGKRALQDGKVAATYFFSTSCGTTTSSKDVFFTGEELPYLKGKLQEADLGNAEKMENAKLVADTFGNEDLFSKFLKEDRNVLEKNEAWYRWSTTISLEDIEHNINQRIGERCKTSGEKIQVRQKDGKYVSQAIDSIGKLKRIKIKERGSGGVVSMAVFVGSDATVRVYSEYNIRQFVFNENAIVRKQDGKDVSGMKLLPSGFFTLTKSGSSYEIKGGGFGHGTGLSQTGANELAKANHNYEEILKYYYENIEIG